MNADRHKRFYSKAPSENPYQQLYVYYLEGQLESEACLSGKTYLGNWQEEGSSFLFFSQPADKSITRLLDLQPQLRLCQSFCMTHEEWQGGKIESLNLGRFFIVPPW